MTSINAKTRRSTQFLFLGYRQLKSASILSLNIFVGIDKATPYLQKTNYLKVTHILLHNLACLLPSLILVPTIFNTPDPNIEL